jgi:hypothetical protein
VTNRAAEAKIYRSDSVRPCVPAGPGRTNYWWGPPCPARGRRRFTSSTVAVNRLTGGGWPGGRNISPDPISACPRGPRIKLSRRSSVTFRSAQHSLRPSPNPNTNGNSVRAAAQEITDRSFLPSCAHVDRLASPFCSSRASELLNWFFDRGEGDLAPSGAGSPSSRRRLPGSGTDAPPCFRFLS